MHLSGPLGVPPAQINSAVYWGDGGCGEGIGTAVGATVGVSSGGHSAVGATATLSSSYAFVDGSIADDPNTGSPPTAVAADAFQFFREEIA